MPRHVKDIIVIMEEGKFPHPYYPDCNIFMPWSALKNFNPILTSAQGGRKGSGGDWWRRKHKQGIIPPFGHTVIPLQ